MKNITYAPWTKEQIKALNILQTCGLTHPYTCGNDNCRATLVATEKGWICPTKGCDYEQNWATIPALCQSDWCKRIGRNPGYLSWCKSSGKNPIDVIRKAMPNAR